MKKLVLFIAIIVMCVFSFSACFLFRANNTDDDITITNMHTQTSTSTNQIVNSQAPSTDSSNMQVPEPEPEKKPSTEGLSFTLLTDGTYAVSVGEATNESEIVIPSKYEGKDVTVILEEGFANCDNLTTIVIPSSITDIGQDVFYGCDNLTTIYCESTSKPSGFHWSWAPISTDVYWYSESEPSGRFYWHYVNGEITIWE